MHGRFLLSLCVYSSSMLLVVMLVLLVLLLLLGTIAGSSIIPSIMKLVYSNFFSGSKQESSRHSSNYEYVNNVRRCV